MRAFSSRIAIGLSSLGCPKSTGRTASGWSSAATTSPKTGAPYHAITARSAMVVQAPPRPLMVPLMRCGLKSTAPQVISRKNP